MIFFCDLLFYGYCLAGINCLRDIVSRENTLAVFLSNKEHFLFYHGVNHYIYILVSVSGRNKENQFTVDISTTTRNQIEPAGHSSFLYLSYQYVRVLHCISI